MNYTIINHRLVKSISAKVSVQDRGFRFGDGVFETCLIKNGSIYNWSAHFARLSAGIEAIKINFDESKLLTSCLRLILKNKVKNGILRVAISRGVGSLGYLPKQNIKPTLIIETLKKPTKPKSPIKLMISSYQKPSLGSLPVNFKLMNGLNSTLIKIEAQEKGYFDGIILNDQGQICETSSANIFWIKDDVLFTPDLECGCLAGTIRSKIIDISPLRIEFSKAKTDQLMEADEVFLTNVAIGVLSVDEINKNKLSNKKHSITFNNLLQIDAE
ncbi:MAG: aminodeoxychorismate lyase [Rickettsiales bacterium]|jgi:aminodeoxychorismate lyase